MTTDLTTHRGRWLRPQVLIAFLSGLLLALGAGWGAASAAQATATPAVTPAPNAPRLTIDIGQLNDSGVTGTATLYEIDANETLVEISVKNVSGNHPSHIHAGTCDKIAAEPAFDLQNIDKNGKSTTLVKVALKDLLAKPYVIDAHLSPNELGTLIMCGEIKGTPATPTVTPAATTPAATKAAATTPAATATAVATTPAAITTAVATTPAATATATTPPPTATATATAAVAPTGAGGEQGVTTPIPTTPAVAPAVTPTVTSGKGIPAANGAAGGDGTGGSTASSTTMQPAASASTAGRAAALPAVANTATTGTATVFPTDDGTGAVIQISLQGALVGPDNLVHLHMGTCANLDQSYTLDLNPVDGNGVSETVVGIPYQELVTGGYAINVHESADAYDTWLVCGQLSAVGGSAGSGGLTVNLLPQRTGAGTSIPRPQTAAEAIAWALGWFALLVGGCAFLVRRRESAARHSSSSRWLRLGL